MAYISDTLRRRTSAWLLLMVFALITPSVLQAQDSAPPMIAEWEAVIDRLGIFFQKRGEHIYWLDLDLDGKVLDSDYIWNGKSDLFFRIEKEGDPKPIFSPSYHKDFTSGRIRVPFVLGDEYRGANITVTVLDDDSGGRVLDLILSNSSVRAASETKSTSVTVGTPLGAAEISNGTQKTNELVSVIDYPQWLIQLEDCEVVASPIRLKLPAPGESSPTIFVQSTAGKRAGTARVLSSVVHADTRKYTYAGVGALLVLSGVIFFLRRKMKLVPSSSATT